MAKGNPTALYFLMAHNLSVRDDPWQTTIRPQRALFGGFEKFNELASAEANCIRPAEVDRMMINELIAQTYLDFCSSPHS